MNEESNLSELLEERKKLKKKSKKISNKITEITKLINETCEHEIEKTYSGNNHDGYSRCGYVEYYDCVCTICGYRYTQKKEVDSW